MIQGPNDLPEILKTPPLPPSPAPVKRKPVEAAQPFQAADTVQISPKAQVAQLVVKAKVEPDIRPARVEQARVQLSAIVKDSASLNAKLAEKLLTEN